MTPVFSYNLPEQPQQENEILTKNTNDLRDCVASSSAAHPEVGESSKVIDIDMNTLVELKSKACSETNFTVQLFKKYLRMKRQKNILAGQRERTL